MPNQTYALEWLEIAGRNLETAEVLLKQDHYTDIIAIEIHQTIEKTFKAVLAFNGVRIPKTHDLMHLFELCHKHIDIPETFLDELLAINDYYETERSPGPRYSIPGKTEIENHISVAKQLYQEVNTLVSSV